MTIDAHQHFWHFTPIEYGWIDDSMARIRRDFLPEELRVTLDRAQVEGCVAVQARQTLDETRWLLGLAAQNEFIRGVVGWAPLREATLGGELDALSASPFFRGVRHVVQAEPEGFLDDPAFNRGIRELTKRQLAYDILIVARQLEEALRFVDRHPEQVFVLNHIAKPTISGEPDPRWRQLIGDLAQRANVYCKFSGLVTEVEGWRWTPALLRPYFDVVLESFGPGRLLFGSDWPVCLVATDYSAWFEFVTSCAASLSVAEQQQIFGDTATQAYRLPLL